MSFRVSVYSLRRINMKYEIITKNICKKERNYKSKVSTSKLGDYCLKRMLYWLGIDFELLSACLVAEVCQASNVVLGYFRGSPKEFLQSPWNPPPLPWIIPYKCLGGFSRVGHDWVVAWVRKHVLECFGVSLWLFCGVFVTLKWKTVRIWHIEGMAYCIWRF